MSENLKKALLNIAEGHAKQAVEDVYAIAEVYVKDTANPLDDTVLEGLKLLKGLIDDAVDKIDGEEG